VYLSAATVEKTKRPSTDVGRNTKTPQPKPPKTHDLRPPKKATALSVPRLPSEHMELQVWFMLASGFKRKNDSYSVAS